LIFVISTIHIKPGTQEACIAAAKACVTETRKEDGCLSYDLHASVTEADKLVFVERWESRAHLDAHTRTPHFLAWRQIAGPLITDRNVEIINPAEVTGL
jgi:quinol monooxygenase YgiN